MLPNVDLNLLNVFLEVYRFQSFTLAAESLNMTQPGVSGAIKRLKEQIGAELFLREGRGITPTATAVKLANDIEVGLTLINNALKNIDSFDAQSAHQFTVIADEPAMHLFQSRVAHDTSMGNCSIKFIPSPATDDEIFNLLNFQKADLAIDISTTDNTAFASRLFYQEEMVLACRKNHPLFKQQISADEYYAAEHVILRFKRSRLSVADLLTAENLKPRKESCEVDSIFSMMALLSKNNCLGLLTKNIAKEQAQNFGLKLIPFPFESSPMRHQMIWHKRNEQSLPHQWLRNKLTELLPNNL